MLCFFSKSERDKAVAQLNKNLSEVESGLSDAEHRKPALNEKDSVDLDTAIKQLEEQKVRDYFAVKIYLVAATLFWRLHLIIYFSIQLVQREMSNIELVMLAHLICFVPT